MSQSLKLAVELPVRFPSAKLNSNSLEVDMSLVRKAVIVGLLGVGVPLSGYANGGSSNVRVTVVYYPDNTSDLQDRTVFTAAYQHSQLLSEVDDNVMCWQDQKMYLAQVAPRCYAQDVVQHMQNLHIDQERESLPSDESP